MELEPSELTKLVTKAMTGDYRVLYANSEEEMQLLPYPVECDTCWVFKEDGYHGYYFLQGMWRLGVIPLVEEKATVVCPHCKEEFVP